jgi:hypothetical protein
MDAAAMMILMALQFLLLGAVGGTVHFTAIAEDAKLLLYGGSVASAFALRLGRLLLTTTILIVAARQNWVDLLAATIGFMAARQYLIARLGPAT